MSHNKSSSSQNSRVFSPTVILQQPSSRIAVTLDGSGAAAVGYSIASGITGGDCIRYDADSLVYRKSEASIINDSYSEVFGVVESKAGNKYNVVIHGSIQYPQERLNPLQDAAYLSGLEDTVLDVLFLDNNPSNIGGLTGQVVIPTGADIAVVKPVIQLAKHGNYNGIVTNYMAYKIGNSVQLQFGPQQVGTIIQSSGNPGEEYLDLSLSNQTLSVVDNPILYSQFGTKSGTHTVKLTMASSANVGSIIIGSLVTQSSPAGNGAIGQVISTSGNTVTISRTSSSQSIYNGYCSIGSVTFQIIGSTVTQFTLPVEPPKRLADGTLVKYWISKTPLINVTIPEQLTTTAITTETVSLDGIDLGETLQQIQTDIDIIKNRIGL